MRNPSLEAVGDASIPRYVVQQVWRTAFESPNAPLGISRRKRPEGFLIAKGALVVARYNGPAQDRPPNQSGWYG